MRKNDENDYAVELLFESTGGGGRYCFSKLILDGFDFSEPVAECSSIIISTVTTI